VEWVLYPKISTIPANFSWWSRVLDQLYDVPSNFKPFPLTFLGGVGVASLL
jgi:hypothetical protein